MVIYSVKVNRKKLLWTIIIAVCALIILLTAGVRIWGGTSRQMSGTAVNTAAMQDIDLSAETTEQQVAFLRQLGFDCGEQPTAFLEVIIPQQFNGVYESYNELQKQSGFDLTRYQGRRVKRYTYPIYGYQDQDMVANLLVYDGKVIGGDVCSLAQDGFMEGLHVVENTQ